MRGRQPGNGSGRFEIESADMGGWVRVFPKRMDNLPEDLPVYLGQTLAQWFRERPQLHLRCVVPISKDGDTVELHG
jgi:hypothetical protein